MERPRILKQYINSIVMSPSKVVIAGAGAGGLSLLRQIKASALEPLHITVVEPDPSSIDDRNWCQWVPQDQVAAYHTSAWASIQTRTPQGSYVSRAQQWSYVRTTGGHYRSVVEQTTSKHHVEWLHSRVKDLHYNAEQESVTVTTDHGDLEADFVFTSVHGLRSESPLWQHFHGWEVEADRDIFDPECATLMDFDVPQVDDGVVFMYVLPYSARRALVECTAFSPSEWEVATYERYLDTYIGTMWGLSKGDYRRILVEHGRIPMRSDPPPRQPNPRTWPIGSPAGTIKPSTGYAFTRIQESCRHLVHTWEQHGMPMLPRPRQGRFAWYDALMLDMIVREPHYMVPVFDRLFGNHSIDRIFRFLDEKTDPLQDALIFMKLPKKPFLKALWRTVTS